MLPRPGKAAGAYCTSVSKTILPYVLMNYTERLRDVSTLAHEFGHATHNVIALEQQTWRSHRTGIPMAEVPSTFAQAIADDYLLENESDPGTRAALAADRLENAFAAIYRQTVLARFEQRAYGLRVGGPLARGGAARTSCGLEENGKYYGDALEMPAGYALGWSYIPHFIHVRFYTYAYSFAQLVALLLYRRFREDPEAFAPKYLELLAAGGSASPARARRAVRARPPLDRHLARSVCRVGRLARRSRETGDTGRAVASAACSTCCSRGDASSARRREPCSAPRAARGCHR